MEKRTIAVSGPDLDADLCRRLTPGDRVMLETNGLRLYSQHDCPVVDQLWEVMGNDDALRVRHPNGIELALAYDTLCNQSPAVFRTTDERILPNDHFYVIPQFVEHFMPADEVDEVYKPHAKHAAAASYATPAKKAVFAFWAELLSRLVEGWGNDGLSRFTIRCYLDLEKLEAIRGLDWHVINEFSSEEFVRVSRAFHWAGDICAAAGVPVPEPRAKGIRHLRPSRVRGDITPRERSQNYTFGVILAVNMRGCRFPLELSLWDSDRDDDGYPKELLTPEQLRLLPDGADSRLRRTVPKLLSVIINDVRARQEH